MRMRGNADELDLGTNASLECQFQTVPKAMHKVNQEMMTESDVHEGKPC